MRRGSGAIGNLRLTSLVGLVLLVLLAVEGATITSIQQLLSVHVFVGMLLLGPVALKLAATGYRFARYYTGGPEYVREGPPAAAHAPAGRAGARPLDAHAVRDRRRAPRSPAPGHRARAPQGELHRLVRRDDDPRARVHAAARCKRVRADLSARRLPGRGLRVAASVLAVAAGLGIAVATYPLARPWFHSQFRFEGDAARPRRRCPNDVRSSATRPAAAYRPRLARAAAPAGPPGPAPRLPPDRRPQQQPGARRVTRREGRVGGLGASRPRRRLLHARAGARSSRTRSSTTR